MFFPSLLPAGGLSMPMWPAFKQSPLEAFSVVKLRDPRIALWETPNSATDHPSDIFR